MSVYDHRGRPDSSEKKKLAIRAQQLNRTCRVFEDAAAAAETLAVSNSPRYNVCHSNDDEIGVIIEPISLNGFARIRRLN
jgi:hypothetical protein